MVEEMKILGTRLTAVDRIQTQIAAGNALVRSHPSQPERRGPDLLDKDVRKFREDVRLWGNQNARILRSIFPDAEPARKYHALRARELNPSSLGDVHASLSDQIAFLRTIQKHVDSAKGEGGTAGAGASGSRTGARAASRKVLVVQSTNRGPKFEVIRLLQRLRLEVLVMDEDAGGKRSVAEILEKHSDLAQAVVLLTGDEIGGRRTEGKSPPLLRPRARQKVLFELGYCAALLGRDRVIVLVEEGIESPPAAITESAIPLDPQGAWKLKLTRGIEAGGIQIDSERIQ